MTVNPFDYINAINNGKHIIRDSDNKELAEKDYNPFLTNRSFSYFRDTILIANEMNSKSNLLKLQQYDFYINTVRPKKRFSKWAKQEKDLSLDIIVEYYKCSFNKAKQILKLLSDDDLKEMKKKLEKGGIKK
jgi:hypothetical protein